MRRMRKPIRIRHRRARTRLPRNTLDSWLHEPFSFVTREQIAEILQSKDRRKITVCFTGHRHIAEAQLERLIPLLDEMLEMCYQHGMRDFLCGGALGFDTLAAERVVRLRDLHAGVRLILVLPCSEQAVRWAEVDVHRYELLLYAADEIRVLSPAYYQGCMMARNQHMVDHSSLCLCYLQYMRGGTLSTVTYALQRKVPIINLATDGACDYFLRECRKRVREHS